MKETNVKFIYKYLWIFIMLITVDLLFFFQFELLLFTTILLLLYIWISALHLPASNYLFWMSLITEWLPQWAVFLKIQFINKLYFTEQLFIPFISLYIFTAFKYDAMLLSNQYQKRNSGKMRQRQSRAGERQKQDPIIHIRLQKQREGVKKKKRHRSA